MLLSPLLGVEMLQRLLLTLAAIWIHFEIIICNRKYGPMFPPSKGVVWPRPMSQSSTDVYYVIHPRTLKITVTGKKCAILRNALKRYSILVSNLESLIKKNGTMDISNLRISRQNHNLNFQGEVWGVTINTVVSCEEYPYFGMDETYFLKVSNKIELISNTIWGSLRGLETFLQLIHISDDYSDIIIRQTDIRDKPRYPHRGLLIDTSRHYISVRNILKTLDALAINKMNVLHWHIVDDQSFPYQSENLPNLSYYGAFHRTMVYTKHDIKVVVNYARFRGIRVIPDFDVPSHTRSWGQAYPNILAKCHKKGVFTDYGPLNPTRNDTYKLLEELFAEVQEWFPDKYFHVGGDEVDFDCWKSDRAIRKYMQDHLIPNTKELFAQFMDKVFRILDRRSRSIPIVWQEVFVKRVPLPRDTMVQVWKFSEAKTMTNILLSGYRVLYSSRWYLDQPNIKFEQLYCEDPRRIVKEFGNPRVNVHKIVGGEACMWGEKINDMNIINSVWPYTCAVAEVLWSPESICEKNKPPSDDIYSRLEEQTCRMNCRGVPAEPPFGPGFCVCSRSST